MVQTKITIVGRNHYKNITLAPEERIFLQREPENTYDENAIAAYKQSGILFGHVIGSTARKFSSILSLEDDYRVLFQVVLMGNSDVLSLSRHRS